MGSAALKSTCHCLFRPAPHPRSLYITPGVMSNSTVEFFSQLCQTQLDQPLSKLDAANDGLGATLVLRAEPCSFCAALLLSLTCWLLTCCFQAVMYAVSAAVSAYFFAMWKRADADLRSRVWRRYGWFSALAFVGSCAGLVTAVGDNQFRYSFHRFVASSIKEIPCHTIQLKDFPDTEDGVIEWFKAILACMQADASDAALWMYRLSVSPVPYAIEFLCICCANLLVRFSFFLCLPVAARLCRPSPHNVDHSRLSNAWLILSVRGNSSADVG